MAALLQCKELLKHEYLYLENKNWTHHVGRQVPEYPLNLVFAYRNNLVVVVKMCGVWVLLAEPTAYSLLGRSPPVRQATCIQYAEAPDPSAKFF